MIKTSNNHDRHLLEILGETVQYHTDLEGQPKRSIDLNKGNSVSIPFLSEDETYTNGEALEIVELLKDISLGGAMSVDSLSYIKRKIKEGATIQMRSLWINACFIASHFISTSERTPKSISDNFEEIRFALALVAYSNSKIFGIQPINGEELLFLTKVSSDESEINNNKDELRVEMQKILVDRLWKENLSKDSNSKISLKSPTGNVVTATYEEIYDLIKHFYGQLSAERKIKNVLINPELLYFKRLNIALDGLTDQATQLIDIAAIVSKVLARANPKYSKEQYLTMLIGVENRLIQ